MAVFVCVEVSETTVYICPFKTDVKMKTIFPLKVIMKVTFR